MQKEIDAIKTLVRGIFKNVKGEPYELTNGQAQIFMSVIDPHYKWLWLSAPTRYGKTDILSMALLYLAVFHHLKIPIVGGSEEKANKIMEYVLQHVGDHRKLSEGLLNVEFTDVEKLKVTVSKDALRWHLGGWLYVTSVDARNISKEGERVVGEGGDVIVLEEAGLIRKKEQFSKVVRMPEEDRGWGKLIMSGNCIEKSVFETAFKDPLYKKVRVDLDQSIAEGRFSRAFLEQKKTQTTTKDWKRYYEVKFPDANEFTYFKPKTFELLPDDLMYYGSLDPALGEAKTGSLVGAVVLGRSKKTGQVYEVFNFGRHITPEEAIKLIFNMPYEFQRYVIEAIQFQKYFFHVLEDKSKTEGKYIPFEGLQQKRNKDERIESMEPIINTGQILFQGEGELWDEMQDYPTGEFKDVLDALEMAWRAIGIGQFEFEVI